VSDARALTVDAWGEPRSKTVSWYDPAISATAGASTTGREHLQAIIDGKVPVPPFAALVGARLHSAGDGEAIFRCTPDESTYNPAGIVHGGLLCMLLDSACGCAVQSLLPAGVAISSIEIKVSFLSALRSDGGELEIIGKALRVGRQVGFAEAHARSGEGKLVGHATSSIALIRPA
jgi:uncharacterized protein (TIGR00369 family)